MTLIEILLSACLTALLLGLFGFFLVPAMRYSAQGAALAEVQQQALVALNRIESDLHSTRLSGLTLVAADVAAPTQEVGVAVVPIADVTTAGGQIYTPGLVADYWDRAQQRLYRKTWKVGDAPTLSDPPSADQAVVLPQAAFLSLVRTPGNRNSLASGVSRFEVSHAGSTAAVVAPIHLHIVIDRSVSGHTDQPIRCDMERDVALRYLD